MDTTKQNILMCEKAEKIQQLFNPKEFNFLWDGVLRNNWDQAKHSYVKYIPYSKTKYGILEGRQQFLHYDGEYTWSCIWLPQQDQLQRMIRDKFYQTYDMVLSFREIIGYDDKRSMEQLWLAFVMKEKYSKTWNGKEWR